MREQKHKPKRVLRPVQKMLPDYFALPYDGFIRLRTVFQRALPTTKAWTLSTDFQNNVSAALERETKK